MMILNVLYYTHTVSDKRKLNIKRYSVFLVVDHNLTCIYVDRMQIDGKGGG